MSNYCTLFDSGFALKGLNMIDSLARNSTDLKIYVLAMDEKTEEILFDYNQIYDLLSIISLNDFEGKHNFLENIKVNRSFVEYCWTLTPILIEFCLEEYSLSHCTYLDADLFFFSSPNKILNSIPEDKDVLITEHNYYPRYNQESTSGIYCVQFMYFKNTTKGLEVLSTWKKQCLEWCYAKFEDNKFGDQKYLDTWPEKYTQVEVLKNNHFALAPWNIQNYYNSDLPEPVFYHFHFFDMYEKRIDLGFYYLNKATVEKYYIPYLFSLLSVNSKIFKHELLLKSKRKSKRFGIVQEFKRTILFQKNYLSYHGKYYKT